MNEGLLADYLFIIKAATFATQLFSKFLEVELYLHEYWISNIIENKLGKCPFCFKSTGALEI